MKIKLCGFRDEADVRAAIALGIDAVGLNLVATSKRRVSVAQAAVLAPLCPLVWWVIDASPPHELQDLWRAHGGVVQRTDPQWPWPDWLPERDRVDVVRLVSADDVIAAYDNPASSVLVDAPRALGGTGEVADWTLAATLARSRPTWLAGGLTPENVAEAITRVHPYGVDVASGIEENGTKSHERMQRFVAAVRQTENK